MIKHNSTSFNEMLISLLNLTQEDIDEANKRIKTNYMAIYEKGREYFAADFKFLPCEFINEDYADYKLTINKMKGFIREMFEHNDKLYMEVQCQNCKKVLLVCVNHINKLPENKKHEYECTCTNCKCSIEFTGV